QGNAFFREIEVEEVYAHGRSKHPDHHDADAEQECSDDAAGSQFPHRYTHEADAVNDETGGQLPGDGESHDGGGSDPRRQEDGGRDIDTAEAAADEVEPGSRCP